VMGPFTQEVTVADGVMQVGHHDIRMLRETDPTKLPWAELGVDVVIESTGVFRDRASLEKHLQAGATRVVLTVPPKDAIDEMVVLGVNDDRLDPTDVLVSNASCTTNCLAPLAKVLDDAFGIERGLMTTVHAYTNDQVLTDVYHTDLRRARSATQNMIPTKTGAAAAVGLVLPELVGKFDGFAVRVPTINVSMVDLTFEAGRETTAKELDEAVRKASQGALKGVLEYIDEPLVSSDFNHNPASSLYDTSLTKVIEGKLVKVCSWYDNEWGFSNRMLDTTLAFAAAK